jgi:hypothetical protein
LYQYGDTSNIVFDTRTTSLGIGVTGSNDPSSNLYITGNAYVSSNLAIGGVMTMGVVNVAARHNLQAVTDMGNVTTHTVEFTNPTTSIVASGPINGYTKISASGGTESTTNAPGYKTHTFTSATGTFTVTAPGIVEYLIVAGGGSGGAGRNDNKTPGAGGGGGGVLSGKCLVATGSHAVVVGDGGASVSWGSGKAGINGQNSSFNGKVAIGGGGGRVNTGWTTSSNGGSGGGCGGGGGSLDGGVFNKNKDPGRGITGAIPQGNDGGRPHPDSTNAENNNAAGGGGGAGSKGYNAYSVVGGNGGDGVTSTISGSSVTYAGGGGGSGPSWGYGGTGGGGNGINTNGNASSGTGGLGGGGGGHRGGGAGNSGAGGSGVVIIRYLS